ncbi:A/G-specific adenine glycosylase [Chryseotalea sanaruensis]|uniref:Adenine DNA glycosylase n=1 Tax=Chryseotalea sanaruensis TaxID=2482724 RepID=A0A401U883_9BACT|nr:A/G-specific adenine glycosylase [Chryseotalea sanaruensis]GCC51087.1 A/G-specific adenine glycosylase [Chryseotalea sanaruensis]
MSKSLPKNFASELISWYSENKRELPWRRNPKPYNVWLSEIILQQTRVNQGLPYYYRFIEHFSTVKDLAAASEQEVLRLWQGLGYYSRARNLHKCAKQVCEFHKGVFPQNFEALKKLPGIGDYTAAAIASICYKEPVAVVDGNVYRVMARVFGIDTPINSPKAKPEFFDLGNKLIDTQRPDEYNQGIMEFGALHCTPRNPKCDVCPLSKLCIAKQKGLQGVLPVKEKKLKVRKRYFYYLVRRNAQSLAMKKREEKDIWQGLYDFELVESTDPLDGATLAKRVGVKKILWSEEYKHILTHQIIFARFAVLESKNKDHNYFSYKKIAALPKPVLISKFLSDKGFLK